MISKKIILFIFCGFIIMDLQSQNFEGGVILGISTSQVSGDRLGGFNKAGILVGGFANTSISSILRLQMEMIYIKKGSNNPEMQKNEIADISLSYLEVPIFLRYRQNKNIQIEAGMAGAILLDSDDNDFYGVIPNEQTLYFDKYDWNILVGVNYQLTKKLILNSRLSNSITPIRKHASGSTFKLNKGQYNSVLSFTFHYII